MKSSRIEVGIGGMGDRRLLVSLKSTSLRFGFPV